MQDSVIFKQLQALKVRYQQDHKTNEEQTFCMYIEMFKMQADQTATRTRKREEGGTKDEVARQLGNFPVSLLLLLLQHLFSLLSRSSPSILVDVSK